MLELSECCIGGGKQRTCSTGMLSESFRRRYLFNTAKIWLLRIWNLRMRSTIFFSGWQTQHINNISSVSTVYCQYTPVSAHYCQHTPLVSTLYLSALFCCQQTLTTAHCSVSTLLLSAYSTCQHTLLVSTLLLSAHSNDNTLQSVQCQHTSTVSILHLSAHSSVSTHFYCQHATVSKLQYQHTFLLSTHSNVSTLQCQHTSTLLLSAHSTFQHTLLIQDTDMPMIMNNVLIRVRHSFL